MRHIILIGIIFSLLLSCTEKKEIIIATHTEAEKDFIKNVVAYNDYKVTIIDNGSYLTVKNVTMDMLLEIRNIVFLEIDIINDNIKNVNTTRTENGGPYIRKFVRFTAENGVEIAEDTETNIRLVYDPIHPDAKRTGERQGYVEYPNVDMASEMIDLIRVNRFFESISDYLSNNFKNVIF